jgi:hypothetical protein
MRAYMEKRTRGRILRITSYLIGGVGALYLTLMVIVWPFFDGRLVHTAYVEFDWEQAKGFKDIKAVYPALAYPLIPQVLPRISSELQRQGWKTVNGWCGAKVLGGVLVLSLSKWAGCKLVDPEVTPLMHAAEDGDFPLVEKLLAERADPNVQDQHGWTALMHATFMRRDNALVIRTLIRSGANPNIKDREGLTALHWASRNCQPGIAEALIQGGADLTQYGQAALYQASYAGCTKIRLLLNQSGVKP